VGSQTRAAITERKTRLDGSVSEYACEPLLIEAGRRAALRYVIQRGASIGGGALVLEPGTVTVGHYWTDRPYNVYHWLAGGRTVAYYCNVATETTIAPELVAYTDLVVDVLLRPSGETLVLDEDELPDDLAPPHRLVIAKALEALITSPRTIIREIERETAIVLRLNVPPVR
jgi:predicted RNA-binding protein associated with RNAse of E/G family